MLCSHAASCCGPLNASYALRTAFSLSHPQGVINKAGQLDKLLQGENKNTAVKNSGFQSGYIQRIVGVLYGRMLCLLMNIQKEPFGQLAAMENAPRPQAGEAIR